MKDVEDISDSSINYKDKEKIIDDVANTFLQIKEVLQDVLPKGKFQAVMDRQIFEQIANNVSDQECEEDEDYSGEYYPIKKIDIAVRNIVKNFQFKKKEGSEAISDVANDDYMNTSQANSVFSNDYSQLQILVQMYPNEDIAFLKETIEKLKCPVKIQEYIENNIVTNPKRRTMQDVQYQRLKILCKSEENLWQCPECGYWKKISRKPVPLEVTCDGTLSCGSFCYKCRKKYHAPYKCPKVDICTQNLKNNLIPNVSGACVFQNIDIKTIDDPNDLFKKVPIEATEKTDIYRKFKLPYSKNFKIDMGDPLAGLCKTALDKIPEYMRERIEEINYYENDAMTERFQKCKQEFENKSISNEESLLCHGTDPENVSSIIEKGFLLSMCKVFVHGFGIYFADQPTRAKCHGRRRLLLCRVLRGIPYVSNYEKGLASSVSNPKTKYQSDIPAGFNSKIKSSYVIIDKEEQILPAFEIVFNDIKESYSGLFNKYKQSSGFLSKVQRHEDRKTCLDSLSSSNTDGKSKESFPQASASNSCKRTNDVFSLQNEDIQECKRRKEVAQVEDFHASSALDPNYSAQAASEKDPKAYFHKVMKMLESSSSSKQDQYSRFRLKNVLDEDSKPLQKTSEPSESASETPLNSDSSEAPVSTPASVHNPSLDIPVQPTIVSQKTEVSDSTTLHVIEKSTNSD